MSLEIYKKRIFEDDLEEEIRNNNIDMARNSDDT